MRPTIDINEYQDVVAREQRLAKVMERPVQVTWILLGLNVVIWLAGLVYGVAGLGIETVRASGEQLALFPGMKVNELVYDGQWWRLISSQYVHLSMMHMLFNGYGLYVLGPILEKAYGPRRFFVLYLASGTVGSVASLFFTEGASGGASGAIYGLVGALLVFGWKYREELPRRVSKSFTTRLLPWVVFSLAIGFLDFLPMDNAAHLGGLAGGAVIVAIMASVVKGERSRVADVLVTALTVVGVGLLIWTGIEWAQEAMRCLPDADAFRQCYPDLIERISSPR
ncbi:MAG: rhomboid family intramembrane serine protease [Myxococcota bacterium]